MVWYKNPRLKGVIVLVIIFGLGFSIVYLSNSARSLYVELPRFSDIEKVEERVMDGKTVYDTVYKPIEDFTLTSHEGKEFTRKNLEGKAFVADFFFTRCKNICKDLSSNMSELQKQFEGVHDVVFLSFTVDPEYDTAAVLAEYAEQYDAIKGKWYFLTGDKQEIYNLATKSFKVTAVSKNADISDLTHADRFVLVDKDGVIRGYYYGTDKDVVDVVRGDLNMLLKKYRLEEKENDS